MQYRKRDELTIIDLSDSNLGNVSYEVISEAILNKPSNIIYCETNGKLQGIICMGDVVRANEKGENNVAINKNFTCILENEFIQARKSFREKDTINEIPVISMKGRLIGDYLRWDDMLVLEAYQHGGQMPFCGAYNHIALIQPNPVIEKKQKLFQFFYSYLVSQGVKVDYFGYDEIGFIGDVDVILFIDEEERRALDVLTILRSKDSEKENGIIFRRHLYETYKSFLQKIGYGTMGEYLKVLQEQGIHILNLHFNYQSAYWKQFKKEIDNKFNEIGEKIYNKLYKGMLKSFFDDLYREKYVNSILNMRFSIESKSGCSKLKDCNSQFYNVSNGERYTCGQPTEYCKTIYFVGPCFIYGHYVEDKYTIESFLQKHLNEAGYNIKVVNCGSPAYNKVSIELSRIIDISLRKGDIVLVYDHNCHFKEIPEIDLMDALERNRISAGWMTDSPTHCNHKVNSLYADAIYDVLKPILNETVQEQGKLLYSSDHVKKIYIDSYFKDFDSVPYERIGSIVMNCNPFTYGHRYLIEQAAAMVDFLIIFVVEEDKSLFSFAERYAMVCKGTEDLENVMIVPSGPFILSQTTFPEYFIKEEDEDIVQNVENDITIFAERIASYLHINYRFVGEEPQDEVTNEYNLAMKRILPQSGIEVVELPRKELNGRPVSASWVRKCLEENDTDTLNRLVPESTLRILWWEQEEKFV